MLYSLYAVLPITTEGSLWILKEILDPISLPHLSKYRIVLWYFFTFFFSFPRFPLFTAVYQICYEGKPVQEMISCLQSHPEHI